MKEQDIQRGCFDLLKMLGVWAYKVNNVGIKKPNGSYIPAQTKGIADIVCHPGEGKTVYIEVKTPEGRQSPAQKEFEDNCRFAGIEYWIIRDIEELRDRIKGA